MQNKFIYVWKFNCKSNYIIINKMCFKKLMFYCTNKNKFIINLKECYNIEYKKRFI